MKDSGEHRSKYGSFPYYLTCIVFFFLTHGYGQYVNRIFVTDMLLFGLAWGVIANGLMYLARVRLVTVQKAAIFTGYLLVCYLFFGDIHAGLEQLPVLNRFRAVLTLMLLLGLVLFFYLKKSKQTFYRFTSYLNLVFVILIFTDIYRIVTSAPPLENKAPAIPVSVTGSPDKRPDIYLIILDEYAGNATLKRHFGFDNKFFLDALKDRSFFVAPEPNKQLHFYSGVGCLGLPDGFYSVVDKEGQYNRRRL